MEVGPDTRLFACSGPGGGRRGTGGVHSISSMNNQIDVASIPVTDGVSVAAPVPPRVAGCLCGISVGQD